MCPNLIFFSRNLIVKTCPQNAEVWYKSRWLNRILRSYLCNALKEFIITIREQDDRVVWYWFLPRNTYTYCLPWSCMLNLCPNNTTDYVMLQRILWFPLESHTTDSVFPGCNQIASWWYQGWLIIARREKYYLQIFFVRILMFLFGSFSVIKNHRIRCNAPTESCVAI